MNPKQSRAIGLTLIIISSFTFQIEISRAQINKKADSLKKVLITAKTDSTRFTILKSLTDSYIGRNYDSAEKYNTIQIPIAQKNNQILAEAYSYDYRSYILYNKRKWSEAYINLQSALKLAENPAIEKNSWKFKDEPPTHLLRLRIIDNVHLIEGYLFAQIGDLKGELREYKTVLSLSKKSADSLNLKFANSHLATYFLDVHQLDSALSYNAESFRLGRKISTDDLAFDYCIQGRIYLLQQKDPLALKSFWRGIDDAQREHFDGGILNNSKALAQYYLEKKNSDSSLYYSRKTLNTLFKMSSKELDEAYSNIYKCYTLKNEKDSMLKYSQLALFYSDSLSKNRIKNLSNFQSDSFKEALRLQQLEKEDIRNKSQIRILELSGGLGILLVSGIFLYYSNRKTQKTNKALDSALTHLKTTQSQLIQSEKMASLGELTAGIAHEIQNPLNFINNFSEINSDLIEEADNEIENGKPEEARSILKDLKENEQKISFHGKRAESIVRGMLQHSRKTSGEKEATNLNTLADEYLRLSYHGLRAKDKSFNSEIKTDLDPGLNPILAIPQELGRVFLNLFNNAFYAVNEKKQKGLEGYEPMVSLKTHNLKDKVQIKIRDNGNGIPKTIIDKIFQPFFTTKPTGQGTGLGLSLSYEIIKAQGGEIQVDSKEGDCTEFTILLPNIT